MELLKIGDKLYNKKHQQWGNNVYYQFSTVERLTKTQAVLSCGTKLVNEPKFDNYIKTIGYPTYGDSWNKWHIQTPEILEEAKLEKERQTIVRWFDNRKFSEEDKRIVYTKFKELNILDSVVQK
jgi:hypothetical protein